MIGTTIGPYEIERELGRGGMGAVYEAHDRRLERRVAIKVVRSEEIPDQEARRRAVLEARALSRVSHPFICQIIDVLEVGAETCIVMERIEGESLEQRLGAAALPVSDALQIAAEIAEALVEAHRHGIVHRDVKPSNVMLTRSGHVKVMDFGLARWTGRTPGAFTSTLTGAGVTLGSPGYMSPEQAMGQRVDERSDLFSLGVVLHEMLTGHNPFAADTPGGYFYALFTQTPTAASAVRAGMPSGVDELLASLLSRDPVGRPAATHAQERLSELARAARARGSAATAGVPKTHYARSGAVNIAYQVVGNGPIDLVHVPGWVSNIELMWEHPVSASMLRRLASFSRLILFDKRGTGLSDRVPESELPTLEQRMDDVRAVMDAVGSERAALFGTSEGGNMCVLFAATYPQRTIALVTYSIYARRQWSPDYPWAPTREERERWLELVEKDWGGEADLETIGPTLARDPELARWWSLYRRQSASPRAARALGQMNTYIDVRPVLPAIGVPTLVIHRTGDRDVKVEEGRYIASRIPGARYVELPGDDHLIWADPNQILDVVEPFLRGVQVVVEPDRVLATIVHVMPADSPSSFAVDEIDRLAQRVVRYRGTRVPGREGVLVASFDGPARAIRCALEATGLAAGLGRAARAGVHTGECTPSGSTLRGVAVDLSQRIAAEARSGEVLVTGTVKDLVSGSGLRFEDRGERVFEELPGEWRLFTAVG